MEDGDRRGKAQRQHAAQVRAERHRVQQIAHRVDDPCEAAEEAQERAEDRVEERLAAEAVGEAGIEHSERDGARKVHPRLQKGNRLRGAAWRRHDQHVLRVAKDGVVEEDAKEHDGERDDLFQLLLGRKARFQLREATQRRLLRPRCCCCCRLRHNGPGGEGTTRHRAEGGPMHRRSHDSRVPPSRTGSACEKHAHGLRPHARRGKRLKSGARSHLTITTRETDGPGFDRVTTRDLADDIRRDLRSRRRDRVDP